MTHEEIKQLYDEYSAAEFFEMMDTDMVDSATIEQALGPEAAREYSSFIYLNIK